LFTRGAALVQQVPAEVQLDIELFLRGGLAILGKIERQHYNVWEHRPTLGKWEKLSLVGRVFCRRLAKQITLLSALRAVRQPKVST
jgi:hypothetical protein